MLKCSVIIPVYNVGKFVRQCLESIQNQTCHDFEAIIVDDGATDDSPAICDEFAQKDNRIKVFHKKNGGVSSALNLGLKHAQGDVICFVDGDDWVEHDFFEVIGSFFTEHDDVDVLGFNYVFEYETETRKNISLTDGVFGNEEKNHLLMATIIPKFIERKYKYCLPGIRSKCVKAFRKKIIDTHAIRFNENIPIGEDALFCSRVLSCSNKVALCNYYLYHYRIYQQSCNRKYRDQWNYVFERAKCIQDIPALTQNQDYENVMATYVFVVVKRVLATFLLHTDNKMSLREKKHFLKDFTKGLYLPKISMEMVRYIPEYVPFLLLIKCRLFVPLLMAGKFLFK